MSHDHQQASSLLLVLLSLWPVMLFLMFAPFIKPKAYDALDSAK